jgi:hypothetical protein
LKKETKKLLPFGADFPASVHAKDQKSFASFLQKRRPSLFSQAVFNGAIRRLRCASTVRFRPASLASYNASSA